MVGVCQLFADQNFSAVSIGDMGAFCQNGGFFNELGGKGREPQRRHFSHIAFLGMIFSCNELYCIASCKTVIDGIAVYDFTRAHNLIYFPLGNADLVFLYLCLTVFIHGHLGVCPYVESRSHRSADVFGESL